MTRESTDNQTASPTVTPRDFLRSKYGDEFEGHISPITRMDKLALFILAGILILVGVFPGVMAPLVGSGAGAILRLFGGA